MVRGSGIARRGTTQIGEHHGLARGLQDRYWDPVKSSQMKTVTTYADVSIEIGPLPRPLGDRIVRALDDALPKPLLVDKGLRLSSVYLSFTRERSIVQFDDAQGGT